MGPLLGGAWRYLGRGPRKTVILSIAVFMTAGAAAFNWNVELFALLLTPADGQLSPFDGKPVFSNPVDMFAATLRLSMKAGLVATVPVFTLGMLSHLRLILPSRIWWTVATFVAISAALALAGASFVFFVLVPVSMGFLLSFGGDVAVPVIALDEYMNLLTSLMLAVAVAFQLPIIMYLLTRLRVIPYQRFRRVRKFVPFVAVLFAILITPTIDGLIALMVAAPMWALYEVGLYAAWEADRSKGNYLWFGTLGPWLRRAGIVWVLLRVGRVLWVLLKAGWVLLLPVRYVYFGRLRVRARICWSLRALRGWTCWTLRTLWRWLRWLDGHWY